MTAKVVGPLARPTATEPAATLSKKLRSNFERSFFGFDSKFESKPTANDLLQCNLEAKPSTTPPATITTNPHHRQCPPAQTPRLQSACCSSPKCSAAPRPHPHSLHKLIPNAESEAATRVLELTKALSSAAPDAATAAADLRATLVAAVEPTLPPSPAATSAAATVAAAAAAESGASEVRGRGGRCGWVCGRGCGRGCCVGMVGCVYVGGCGWVVCVPVSEGGCVCVCVCGCAGLHLACILYVCKSACVCACAPLCVHVHGASTCVRAPPPKPQHGRQQDPPHNAPPLPPLHPN